VTIGTGSNPVSKTVSSAQPRGLRRGPNAPAFALQVGTGRTGCGSGSLFATVHSFVLRGKWCLWFGVAFAIGQAWRAASAR
jgi:hypothetical protein